MTEILCQSDAYIQEFDATVTRVSCKGVVLDRTAFYPGGGGQPSDKGFLIYNGHKYVVKQLTKTGSEIVHEVVDADVPSLNVQVHGIIDWDYRYTLMRTHTALHIMGAVVWLNFGAQITGSDMKHGSGRLDFELETMSTRFASKVEKMINDEIESARDITISILPRDKAFEIPDLVRTKISLLPPTIKEIRIVDIKGLDIQADGGTHVNNTSEVGHIRVVGHESKGRLNKRLRIEIDR